jgi:hypothetical protein
MPETIDILFERLRQFDEVSLLELLDISVDDLLERFRDKVVQRKKQLFGEIEIINIDDTELEEEDDLDGFQIVDPYEDGEDSY